MSLEKIIPLAIEGIFLLERARGKDD